MATVTFSVSVGSRHEWPSGRPTSSEQLPDGRVRHQLEDGRAVIVREPTYRVDYLSTWVGAKPEDTYPINLALIGLSSIEGFYEAWNFDIGELRSYKFTKTIRATHLSTGEAFNAEEFEAGVREAVAESISSPGPT
jgi:hypothetical protein